MGSEAGAVPRPAPLGTENANEYDRSVVAEMWFYPDGTDPGAVNQVPPSQTFQVVAESRAMLAGRGIDLSGKQQTKSSTVLRYFSRQPVDASA
jgi:hypothetical protein